ncbi:hypothetical protein [Dactylosporangium sp. CA-092794]|uniref:hypothetical protein n=1 Tax=Dactylosporangium sp. CA-092794 TaxID=3239929 RepID=UPI003D8B9584
MHQITARSSPPGNGGTRRRLIAGAAIAALAVPGASLLGTRAASAAAALPVSDAGLTWALDNEVGAGAHFGVCNFLSAGVAGDTGSSTLWTQTTPAPGYATQAGNVTVEKPDTTGTYHQPTWATRCKGPDDTTTVGLTTTTANRVRFSGGTGTVDPDGNTATIHWTGGFTVVFYGGLTYWSASDPTLTVNGDGTGTLTATLSGFAASMADPTAWSPITPTTLTVATLHGVTVTPSGFTVTPDYPGVTVTTGAGDASQSTGPGSGAWPQAFVDFQHLTGQSSYWYSSGGSEDPAKVPTPIGVAYTTSAPAQSAPVITTQPAAATATVGGTATFTAAASGDPAPTVQWQLQAPGSPAWQDYPGATATTFTLTVHAAGYNGSKVRAVFTNAAGTATTDAVTLAVTTTPPPADSDSETITATVPEQTPAGSFTWTINGTGRAVTLSQATSHGAYLQSTGALLPVTVTDTRTGGPTWSIAGQAGDFNGGALSGKYLGWTPQVTTAGAGAVAGASVTPGLTSGNGLTDASTLASAADGHDPGSATVGADLDLQVPAATPAGTYTAVLTLTALS